MPELKSTKQGCRVRFVAGATFSLQTYDATIHLFEHRYDEHFEFWHGVLEVASNYDEYYEFSQQHPPENIRFHIELEDGRNGQAAWLTQLEGREDGIPTYVIAVSGRNQLVDDS